MPQPFSRRYFMQTAALAAGAVTAPLILPVRAFAANEQIVLGHIGLGGQGTGNLKGFLGNKQVRVAALCDVDSEHLAKASKLVEERGSKPDTYEDYRRLLDRKDIDAVVISTPDHWHAQTTVDACQAGKDVYCEKPLTKTILEGRAMVKAARENDRVVQTGSQQRSSKEFRTACELVRGGALGKLQAVLVGIPGPNHPGEPVPDSQPPEVLAYDLWLGPAPDRPYNKKHVHYNFRFFRDYSGGQMTNWGAHHLDIAQWALGKDDTGPVKIVGTGTFHPQGWHEVTETCRVTHTYDDGQTVTLAQSDKSVPTGVTFIGERGKIYVNRGKLVIDPPELKDAGKSVSLYNSSDHKKNFLECVVSRKKPICDVEIGHRSATVCHLGNIAIDLGRPIEWDPAKEEFPGDAEANAKRMTNYRAPWSLES